MKKRHVYILAAVLTVLGLALYAYKVGFLGYPVVPNAKVDVWEVETRLKFTASGGEVKLALFTPTPSGRNAILERRYVAPGYGLTTENAGPNQRAVISTRKADGAQAVYYRVVVQRTPGAAPAQPNLSTAIEPHGLEEAKLAAAQAIVRDAEARSADRMTFVPLIIERFTKQPLGNEAATLLGANPKPRDVAAAIVKTLAVANVPAHVVAGIVLNVEHRRAPFTFWIEAHVGDKWLAFDLKTATAGIGTDHLVWWRGNKQLTALTGGTDLSVNIATSRVEETALANLLSMARSRRDELVGFSLFSLPIQTQHVYRLLMVVPIGIFLLVLLRNVIGVTTLGTFMPVLIALSFRETQLLWGIVLFVTVVASGLLIRAYFETLKLLLVPRLASVLICVVLIMALLSIISHKLGFDQGLSVALFPMVIMTMTIERLSIVWDERGAGLRHEAGVRQSGGRRGLLPGDEHQRRRASALHLPGTAAGRAGRDHPARPIRRLPAGRAAAVQGTGAGAPLMLGLTLARRLQDVGVLGINRRNAIYQLPYNKRRFYPRVDDKLLTKRLAEKAGIAVPTLYGVVEIARQAAAIPDIVRPYEDFVVKPAQGSGGDGIVVVVGRTRTGGYYRLASGKLMSEAELIFHTQNTVSGVYSLGGQPDNALIEYRVNFDPVFEKIAFQGVPDIRIIVFLGVPVMAMVRLPTRMSEGRANLHQGAIGAGIDIATGRTLTAVWRNEVVTEHPDTLNPVQDVVIPHWPKLLELAARSYELTELGYQGIDIVLDRDRGPLMLELNARPGLNIQIANRIGLEHRLQAVLAERDKLDTLDKRIAFARERFAHGKG